MARLDGKVAVITGATSGIGLRTAELFVAEGARIVIAGRRDKEGAAIAARLGPACVFRRADVTDEMQIKVLIDETVARFGRVDCLLNTAGGRAPTGGIADIPAAGFDAAIALLLRSVVLGMKHAAPVMRRQGGGSIINNGSIAGTRAGYSSSVIYGAAKAAVIHLTRCVAMELGESNIRVNSISPGAIVTGIFGKALGLSVEAAERAAPGAEARFAKNQPIPRAGMPDDIAKAAVFLASDESSFVNGHDLVVDGGVIGGRNWTEQQNGLKALRQELQAAAGD
jgi:NAD(P)-dependent dehydrogenase (short-subunit alcohol dehydrogenase family)